MTPRHLQPLGRRHLLAGLGAVLALGAAPARAAAKTLPLSRAFTLKRTISLSLSRPARSMMRSAVMGSPLNDQSDLKTAACPSLQRIGPPGQSGSVTNLKSAENGPWTGIAGSTACAGLRRNTQIKYQAAVRLGGRRQFFYSNIRANMGSESSMVFFATQ